MSTDCVSVRPQCKQPLLTYAIGALGLALFCLCYGLSAWSTIRFTQHLGDHAGGVSAAPFGVAWETARLFFTLLGFLAGARRRGGRLLFRLAMIAVLNLGSTAASVANLWQQDAADHLGAQARALKSDRMRQTQDQLASVLKGASDAVGVLVAAGKGSKALEATTSVIEPLLDRVKDADVAVVDAAATPDRITITETFFANVASHLWDGDRGANGSKLRSRISMLLAIMADLIILGVPFTWAGAVDPGPHPRRGAEKPAPSTRLARVAAVASGSRAPRVAPALVAAPRALRVRSPQSAPDPSAPSAHAPNLAPISQVQDLMRPPAPKVHAPAPDSHQVRAPGEFAPRAPREMHSHPYAGTHPASTPRVRHVPAPRGSRKNAYGTPGKTESTKGTRPDDLDRLHAQARGLLAQGLLSLNQRDVKAKLRVGQAKAEQILKRLRAEEDSKPHAAFPLSTAAVA